MSYKDKTIKCAGCGEEFEFTASEQAFFDSKGFTSEPKRCKPCRQSRRRKKPRGQSPGEYRSPAFQRSAPEHQSGGYRPSRHGGGGRNSGRSEYRSPAFRDVQSGEGTYRSPAFRDQPTGESEYRAVAFHNSDNSLDDERNQYRAPGFRDQQKEFRQERPLFSIECSACGEKAMVPFLPEEVENPMCTDCYRNQKEQAKAEAAAAVETKTEAVETEVEAVETEVEAVETEIEAVETEIVEAEPPVNESSEQMN